MLKLAFRNIFRNRLRTSLTLAAIAAGVAAIIVSGGFVEDLFVQLREATIHSRLGHLQVYRKGFLEFGQRDPSLYLIADAGPVIAELSKIPHVKVAMTRILFSGLINNGKADLPIIGEGVELDKEARFGGVFTLVEGRAMRDADAYGILLGEGVAAALQLHPGSYVNLVVNTPEGALNSLEFQVIGVFRTFFKEYDDRAVRIGHAAAQELLFTRASHSIVMTLDDTDATDAVFAVAKARLAPLGFEVKPWYALADFYEKTVALYRRQFGALQVIILLMLVLSVASTVNMAVHERTGEFGTVLALGQKRRRVFQLIVIEYTLLGVLGALFGLLLGIILSIVISSAGISMPPPPGSNAGYVANIRLVPWVLVLSAVTGWLSTVFASLLPAKKASKRNIVEALRHNI